MSSGKPSRPSLNEAKERRRKLELKKRGLDDPEDALLQVIAALAIVAMILYVTLYLR